jgi:hypothetical protein
MLQQAQIRAAAIIAMGRITIPMSGIGIRGAGG